MIKHTYIRNSQRLSRMVILAAAVTLISSLSSCVYFNTFYNANKYYDTAEKENENLQEGQLRTQNYTKAIDTAAKIPENWPDSKYVDDALLLMGICYYKVGNYPKAQRKFEELITNYPETELLDEAALYKGKCLIENRSFDEARDVLTELAASSEDKKVVREANFSLGELLFSEEKYIQAADIYSRIAESVRDKEVKSRASQLAAECYTLSENFTAAAEAFKNASKYRKNTLEIRFKARFNWALSLRKADDIAGAEEVLQDIIKDEKFFSFHAQTKVELAEINYLKGNVDEAVEELTKVIEDMPKSEESARASFIMGIINTRHYQDYNKAEEYLRGVKAEKSSSVYADSADAALKILTDWLETVEKIDSLRSLITADENFLAGIVDTTETIDTTEIIEESNIRSLFENKEEEGKLESPAPIIPEEKLEIPESMTPVEPVPDKTEPQPEQSFEVFADSLTADSTLSDSTLILAGEDSLAVQIPEPEPVVVDTQAVLERIAKNRENIDEYRFQLAEILYFQIENPDSSEILLNALADSASVNVAPQALFLLAHIYKTDGDSVKVDSLNRLLVEKYPETPYAAAAGEKLGITLETTRIDSGEIYFKIAEELYFDQADHNRAVETYALVDSLFPESEYAPRSLYTLAYIARNELYDDSLAIDYYKLLADKYPEDTLAVIAAKRTAEPSAVTSPALTTPDTSDYVMEEFDEPFLPEDVDFLPVCEKDSLEISQMITDLGLYPQRALSASQGGVVVLKVTIDVYGYPILDDIEVSKDVPPGYGFGDAAVEAMNELVYTPGKISGRPVPVRIEQRIIFKN